MTTGGRLYEEPAPISPSGTVDAVPSAMNVRPLEVSIDAATVVPDRVNVTGKPGANVLPLTMKLPWSSWLTAMG